MLVAARLKQANLVSKTDFDNKLIHLNRKITANKTKYSKVQEKTFFSKNFFLK